MADDDWRPMRSDDIDGVVSVAAAAFPSHFEGRACFEERFTLFPQGCFVLASGDGVKGYLIAYPWPLGSVPPLNSLLGSLPQCWEALYLHDLALHPAVRGQGYSRPIVERVVGLAQELRIRRIALASVNQTASFWQAMGFEPMTDDLAIRRKLESYGDGSTYMVRHL